MNKQYIFGYEVGNKYYLSPYVDIYKIRENQIILKRRDIHEKIIVTLPSESLVQDFIDVLKHGIQKDEALSYLGNEEMLELFLEKGVLE